MRALRLGLAWVVFASFVLGSIKLPLFKLPRNRQRIARYYELEPDSNVPRYPKFLLNVRSRTAPGSTLAILVPMRTWEGGYRYAYCRASYILAGRRVLPLIDAQNSPRTENLGRAEYLAAWGVNFSPLGYQPVWRGEQGTLWRRLR